jgi:type II restriction enzyme
MASYFPTEKLHLKIKKKVTLEMVGIEEKITRLANEYSKKLDTKIKLRIDEMKNDDVSHYLIYQVLGISVKEGELIDLYQNKGRFLYKYAGSFLEEATLLCFREKYSDSKEKVKVENKLGFKPKTFEIDCLIGKDAFEIKWKDATTDGDHITKEHTRVQAIKSHGYKPIRIMFYYPNRIQAIRIQDALKTIYRGVGGLYYAGDEAWEQIKIYTGINLKQILINIAKEQPSRNETSK